MASRLGNLWLLVAAQTACMAVGLLIHYLYVTGTVQYEAEEQTRSELGVHAQPVVAALRDLNLQGTATDLWPAVEAILQTQRSPRDSRFTAVDTRWQVHAGGQGRNDRDLPHAETDSIVAWTRSLDSFDQVTGPVRGEAAFADGPHVALAYPLADGKGYLLVHRPLAEVKIATSAMTTSFLIAGAIAFAWTCGLFVIIGYMIATHAHDKLKKSQIDPEVESLKRAQALVRTQETVIFGLAKLSDSRDTDTGDHLERISFYSSSLANALRQHPYYRDIVNSAFVQQIGVSSALHDIGKVGIEDAILRKPGSLTEAERARMKHHTIVGEECLKEIERRLGTSNFLKMAREIASFHHERWDGTGYPYGLAGEQIPLAARIVAIADVYDALASKRAYKDAMPHEKCVAIIKEEAGKHFDPQLVEVFLQMESNFRDIGRRFGTGVESAPACSVKSEVFETSKPREQAAVAVAQ